jgi:hypothetical protein
MLDPELLNEWADDAVKLYAKLEQTVTRDIIRRIMKTGTITETAKLQIESVRGLKDAEELYNEVLQAVEKVNPEAAKKVSEIFKEAGYAKYLSDVDYAKGAGKLIGVFTTNAALRQILNAGAAKTNGLIANLTKTIALTSQQSFINAVSLAELQVSIGAYDYNTAIRNAVSSAIDDGVTVEYPSGRKDRLDVAVRRAVLTGVSQTTGEISLQNARDLGTTIMELSAHMGARPSHAEWQGQLVDTSGKNSDYLTLDGIGYGTAGGFKGANCRHDWWPFVKGYSTRAYNDQTLKDYENATVNIDGKETSLYEASQRQRAMERRIRAERTQLAGYDEAIKSAQSEELAAEFQGKFDELSLKLKAHEAAYNAYSQKTTFGAQKDRLQVNGFGRSVSQKAVAVNKKGKAFDKMVGAKTSTGITVNEVGIHSKAQGIQRGVTPERAIDALTNPEKVGKIRKDRSQQFIGKEAGVVINVDTGKIITMWSKIKEEGGSS